MLGTFIRERKGTRELSLDETLRVLGDRVTQRMVALRPLSPVPAVAPFAGSYKRTRRMRAMRFKALSLAEVTTPVERVTIVNTEPVVMQREGTATVKIDRLRIRRKRHLRLWITALLLGLFVLWLIA